ncbi:MAG: hypothetical protein FJ295_09440 [Planctomycetes bacterium]|nr:hypothetical protein [Planctomycetota bacterium]
MFRRIFRYPLAIRIALFVAAVPILISIRQLESARSLRVSQAIALPDSRVFIIGTQSHFPMRTRHVVRDWNWSRQEVGEPCYFYGSQLKSDGYHVAVVDRDRHQLTVTDLKTMEVRARWSGHPESGAAKQDRRLVRRAPLPCKFSANGRFLVFGAMPSGDADPGYTCVGDLQTGTIRDQREWLVTYQPGDNLIVFGPSNAQGGFEYFGFENGRFERLDPFPRAANYWVSLNARRYIAYSDIWNRPSELRDFEGRVVGRLPFLRFLVPSPDGSLFVGDFAHSIEVHDYQSGAFVSRLNVPWSGPNSDFAIPTAMSVSPDNLVVASAMPDNTVSVWDARSGERLYSWAPPPPRNEAWKMPLTLVALAAWGLSWCWAGTLLQSRFWWFVDPMIATWPLAIGWSHVQGFMVAETVHCLIGIGIVAAVVAWNSSRSVVMAGSAAVLVFAMHWGFVFMLRREFSLVDTEFDSSGLWFRNCLLALALTLGIATLRFFGVELRLNGSERKHPAPRLRFTIRDALMLTTAIAVMLATTLRHPPWKTIGVSAQAPMQLTAGWSLAVIATLEALVVIVTVWAVLSRVELPSRIALFGLAVPSLAYLFACGVLRYVPVEAARDLHSQAWGPWYGQEPVFLAAYLVAMLLPFRRRGFWLGRIEREIKLMAQQAV